MILLIALQFAVAVPPRVAPRDSVKLVARIRDAEFNYLMDWRHEWEAWCTDGFNLILSPAMRAKLPPPQPRLPAGIVDPKQVIRHDIDQHEWMAHFIGSPVNRNDLPGEWSVVPRWVDQLAPEHVEEALLGIDSPLDLKRRDTVRARRMRLLTQLDSAARLVPGDSWVVGQRVRMYVDQGEPSLALRATTECRAEAWWCTALRGYVRFTVRDAPGAAATFDTAVKQMPPPTRCQWSDVSQLLPYTARAAYENLTCAQQDSVNARVWWLADPLYLIPTNDRRTEHYARRVLAELRSGNDVDEREDMRDDYKGPAVREMLLRYGSPTWMAWLPPPNCNMKSPVARSLDKTIGKDCTYPVPPTWSRFDARDTYIGPVNPWGKAPADPDLVRFDDRFLGGHWFFDLEVPWPATPLYWGPQYHTVPAWSAINDPLHAQTTDWDLGPEPLDSLTWDSSWWATEFYRRYEGPLVDLSTQIGFIRRHGTAEIAAAMEWPTATTFLAPPLRAVVGVITSGGPAESPRIASTEDDGAHPSAILTPIDSRPLLLGVEMVPPNDTGPAARTRFGIAPPQPLNALTPGTLALSDVLLVRATANDSFPTSIEDALPRMFGSTILVNPRRLAIFWEVYGQADGDTVDVSLRIVRKNDAGLLSRAAAAVGIGQAGSDSITVRWREPRPSDPLAFADSGVSIRSRGFALDVSALAPGAYTLSVRVDRRGASVSSPPREFNIVR